MKKGLKWGSSTLLVILVFGLLESCSSPKPLKFIGLSKFEIENVGMDSATIFTQMDFSNPNTYTMDFKKLSGDIYANNQLVGHYQQDSLSHVLPNVDFHYPARITISMKPILQNAIAAFLNKSVDLKFSGNVKVGRHGIFVTMPLEFSKKQKINF